MSKNIIFIIEDDDTFIDESGRTSLEPEGAGHHSDWNGVGSRDGLSYPGVETGNNAPQEEFFDSEGGYPRGLRPAEGDGGGAPD